jgi:hypothetical protein
MVFSGVCWDRSELLEPLPPGLRADLLLEGRSYRVSREPGRTLLVRLPTLRGLRQLRADPMVRVDDDALGFLADDAGFQELKATAAARRAIRAGTPRALTPASAK